MRGLMFVTWVALVCASTLSVPSLAGEAKASGATAGEPKPRALHRQTWTVDHVEREAMVFAPDSAKTSPTPIVFVFHGHGGKMDSSPERFPIDTLWPEAISVYPQGLNAPGGSDPQGKKPGWQHLPDDQGGRDLKFFDAMLAGLGQEYRLDPKRVYVTGFSNGADFTYVLWATRGQVLSAVAPCAGAGEKFLGQYKPIPAMIVSGEKDPHYKIATTRRVIEEVKKLNACDAKGATWSELCTVYPSKTSRPVGTYLHPLGHTVPPEAPPMIVKFFKSLDGSANGKQED